jgi:zinc protease
MKKHWMQIVVVVLACVAWESSAQEKSVAVDEFIVNGLKVLVKPVSANDIISVQLYLRGGCMNLTEATQGIEHLLLQSALKGSKNYPKEQLNTVLDRTASAITGASTKNFSKVTLRCLKSDIDKLWDVFADVIMRPAFVPEDVEVVRNNILLGIKQRKDNPDSYLALVADEGFYAGHPYRFEPEGVEGSMSALTIDQMKKYLADNLVTSKLLLVVVGNMSTEDVRTKVEATFGKLPQGQYKPVFPAPVVHATPSMKVIEQQMPTNYFRGTFALPGPSDPDHHSTLVMMSVLGTRVWEEVRTKRNLSYAPAARGTNFFANQGFLYVTTVLPDSAVKVMLGEVKRLQNEPVPAKDLKDRITMFLTGYSLARETNESQGDFLAFYELSGAGWKATTQLMDRFRGVSAADIQKVARTYFHNMQTTVIGDPKSVHKEVYQY